MKQNNTTMKNKYYPYKVLTGDLPLTSAERDVVIKWIYDTHIVEWYTTYLMKKSMEEDGVEDRIQELFLMICEIPEEKWKELYAQGQYAVSAYVTGIIHQQIISVNSAIYKKYTKYETTQIIQDELFWETYDAEHED